MTTKFFRKVNIVNGPSKWDMMLALFDPDPNEEFDSTNAVIRYINFKVAKGSGTIELKADIDCVDRIKKDGITQWRLTGTFYADSDELGFSEEEMDEPWLRYEALFACHNRKGILKF